MMQIAAANGQERGQRNESLDVLVNVRQLLQDSAIRGRFMQGAQLFNGLNLHRKKLVKDEKRMMPLKLRKLCPVSVDCG